MTAPADPITPPTPTGDLLRPSPSVYNACPTGGAAHVARHDEGLEEERALHEGAPDPIADLADALADVQGGQPDDFAQAIADRQRAERRERLILLCRVYAAISDAKNASASKARVAFEFTDCTPADLEAAAALFDGSTIARHADAWTWSAPDCLPVRMFAWVRK